MEARTALRAASLILPTNKQRSLSLSIPSSRGRATSNGL